MSAKPFVGAWRLVSLESRTADGEATYPLGRDAVGYILYSEDGHVSVQLAAADRPRFASGDQIRGTVEEKVRAADTYIAYCGTYEVQGSKVIHHVETSFFPNWAGGDQERLWGFEGDRLVLRTPAITMGGATFTSVLVWERARR